MAIAECGRCIRLDLPEVLAGFGVHGCECPTVFPEKHNSAGGGKHAAPTVRRSDLRNFPDSFAGFDIYRAQIFSSGLERNRSRAQPGGLT